MVVLSPLLINHTHKFNVLSTDLKTEAMHCQGQGRKILSSSCPRGRGQSSRTPAFCCDRSCEWAYKIWSS